jgi:hypothetical protein
MLGPSIERSWQRFDHFVVASLPGAEASVRIDPPAHPARPAINACTDVDPEESDRDARSDRQIDQRFGEALHERHAQSRSGSSEATKDEDGVP